MPRRRINEIAQGHRAITADTAARLGAFFGVDAEGWLALQAHYDAEMVRERLGDVLSHIPRYDHLPHRPRENEGRPRFSCLTIADCPSRSTRGQQ